MSSLITGYNYDIFISYRQKDNKHDGWVTKFVENLKGELEATFKEDVSVYFDENPHDRLQETHNVDKSLESKLKCLIFIPILSQTYCDPGSYAWQNEFLVFINMAEDDHFGKDVKLRSGNVASRILPIRIHDLEPEDVKLFEKETRSVLRAMDFVFKTASGVNRPLKVNEDHPQDNLNKTYYSDQINKVAGAIKEIILSMKKEPESVVLQKIKKPSEDLNKTEYTEQGKKARFIFKSRKILLLIVSLFLIIAGGIAIYSVLNHSKNAEKLSSHDKSIAVLPFVNDSPDKENEYFCNGMMEDILDNLVKIEELSVKSRTAVEPYRGSSKTLKEIGKELGVANILEGSVRKQGNRFKISVQLINAGNGFHLWSQTYEGEYTEEIFSIQSNIANQVAKALKTIITREENTKMGQKPTTNIKAYDLVIRGSYEVTNYWRDYDTNHLPVAYKLFSEALEIDSMYIDAIEAKADCFVAQRQWDSVLAYTTKLFNLNPNSGFGYFLRGEYYRFNNIPDLAIENYLLAIKNLEKTETFIIQHSKFTIGWLYCMAKFDYVKGLPYLQKGMEIESERDWAKYLQLGEIFQTIGNKEKTKKYYLKSLELEVNPVNIPWYLMSLITESKYSEALSFLDTKCRKPECLKICYQYRYIIYNLQKDFKQAEQFYNQYVSVVRTPSVVDSIWLAYMYKETGREQLSLRILNNCRKSLESSLAKAKNLYVYLGLSYTFALLDEKVEAIKYLSKSSDVGFKFGYEDWVENSPFYEKLWDDPEFKSIIKRAKDEKAKIRAQVKEMELRGEIDL